MRRFGHQTVVLLLVWAAVGAMPALAWAARTGGDAKALDETSGWPVAMIAVGFAAVCLLAALKNAKRTHLD